MSDYFRQHTEISSFTKSSWVVLGNIEQRIKSKIELAGIPLKDWDIKIYRGVLTGFNDAFIIDEATKNTLIAASPNSANIIRPILRGRDIQKYRANWQGLYIIGTFPSLCLDIDNYPAIKEHLMSFGYERLNQSGQNGSRKKTNNKWFETQDSIGYWDDFSKHKIVWKRIGSVLRFSYDELGMYCLDSTCFATGNDMKFLVGYLNSTVSKRELLNNSPKTGTGDVITSVQALEPLRVPRANTAERNQIISLVNKCITLLSNDINSDISEIENQIDEIVFRLFDLNSEEIHFIKRNIGLT